MPTYIVLANYTDQGIKSIKDAPERAERLKKGVQALGGKLIGLYAVMGQYDRVIIVELPSDEVALSALLQMGVEGNVRTITLKAFPNEEYLKLIQKLP